MIFVRWFHENGILFVDLVGWRKIEMLEERRKLDWYAKAAFRERRWAITASEGIPGSKWEFS